MKDVKKSTARRAAGKRKTKRSALSTDTIAVAHSATNGKTTDADIVCEYGALASNMLRGDVVWLWPPYLPGGLLTLIVGESQAGKSTMLAALAAHVTGGHSLGKAGRCVPGNVLYFAAEEDVPTMTLHRLSRAGADCSRVVFPDYGVDGIVRGRLLLPGDAHRLDKLVRATKAKLVIFDPVTSQLASRFDSKDATAVRGLLDQIGLIAATTGCAVVFTCHYRKSRDGGPLDWIAGSAAWHQVPRVVLALGRDPDDRSRRVLAVPKYSVGLPQRSRFFALLDGGGVPRFELGKECDVVCEDMAQESDGRGERDALADASQFLMDELGETERPAKSIIKLATDLGISLGTLRRAKATLKVTSHPTGQVGDRLWVWRGPIGGWSN